MKKRVTCLILGVLLITLLVLAVSAQNNRNATNNIQNNAAQQQNNQIGNNKTANQTQQQNTVQNTVRTRVQDRTNLTFIPWQKRNESECMQGCNCRGAVVTCETENGKTMSIQAGRSGNTIVITTQRTNASTELELEQELTEGNQTKLKAKLSNGERKELKIMPDEAETKIREKLRVKECTSENNCSLELKEENQQLRYEMQIQRHSKILGIFSKKMRVRAEVDAETGELLQVDKPWWAFLATEPEE